MWIGIPYVCANDVLDQYE